MRLFPIGVAGALVALLLAVSPADAQTVRVKVVSACGAESYPTNLPNVLEMDTTGKLCVAATVSATASIAAFAPVGTNNALAVTSTTARTALTGAAANSTTLVENSGATDVFVAFGDNTVTVTAANGTRVPAGWAIAFNIGTATNIAYITASSTSTINATTGTGLPALGAAGSGGGGGGAITAASGAFASGALSAGSVAAGAGVDGWDLTQGAKADAACGTDNGTCSIAALAKRIAQNLSTLNTTAAASVASGTARIGYVSDDPCTQLTKTNFTFSTTSGTVQIVAPSGSTQVYICSLIAFADTAVKLNAVGGTGAACTTGTPVAAIGSTTAANGMSIPATGGLTFGNGGATAFRTTTAGHGMCLIQSGTTLLAGGGTFVQQ